VHRGFWWSNLKETDRLKNLAIDGRIILKWIFKTLVVGGGGGIHWTDPAWCGDKWLAAVNMVMNFWIP
jgi:hypothetical protein